MSDIKPVAVMNREELIKWLQENDPFSFLWAEDDSMKRLRRTVEAVREVEMIIEEAATSVKRLATKYRTVGIGDTATDEDIAAMFYSFLH